MLKTITIDSFLLINQAYISLQGGLNIISGESGTGKSTIIDAICWGLGMDNKRTKNITTASVQLDFILKNNESIQIIRTIKDCKSNYLLNGKKINKKQLLDSDFLTICRQDNRISFSLADDFRKMIDLQLTKDLLLSQTESYKALQSLRDALLDINKLNDEDQEYMQNIVHEIDALQLTGDDEGKLVLAQREQIELYKSNEGLQKALKYCKGNNLSSGIVSQITAISKNLNSSSPKINSLQYRINIVIAELQDIEASIEQIANQSESNEKSIELIDCKLVKIRSIAKKYKMMSNKLLDFAGHYRCKIEDLNNIEDRKNQLQKDLDIAINNFIKITSTVNLIRQNYCDRLNVAIINILSELMMTDINVAFQLKTLHENQWSIYGNVKVHLTIDDNRILSGGEMSRLVLAIKVATAHLNIPIIFDEIDIGIGGATAYKIGSKLSALGQLGQVIVVTHQPQVAAHGTHHIVVEKSNGISHIKALCALTRIEEIARMISGHRTTKESLLAAKSLIAEATNAN